MKGWKTLAVGIATAILGILEGQHITSWVAQYPGTFATVIGVAMIILRFVTTSPIFKE